MGNIETAVAKQCILAVKEKWCVCVLPGVEMNHLQGMDKEKQREMAKELVSA